LITYLSHDHAVPAGTHLADAVEAVDTDVTPKIATAKRIIPNFFFNVNTSLVIYIQIIGKLEPDIK